MDQHGKASLHISYNTFPTLTKRWKTVCTLIFFFSKLIFCKCFKGPFATAKKIVKRGHLGKYRVHVSRRLRGGMIAIDEGEGFLPLTSSGENESLFCKVHLIRRKAWAHTEIDG